MKIGPSIKTPCPADWNKMKIGVNSRFCGSCEKNVVDFTQKSREEILEYLILNYQTKTCGHFYRDQLDYADEDFMVIVTRLSEKQKDPRLAMAILVFGSMIMFGCNSTTPAPSEANVLPIQNDSIEPVHLSLAQDTPIIAEKQIELKLVTGKEEKPTEPDPPEIIEMIEGEIMLGDIDFGPDTMEQVRTPLSYGVVEVHPEFPGGMDSLQSHIAKNTSYPEKERKAGTQGKVYVGFIIDTVGKIKDARVLRGISPSLDSAALSTITNLPTWKPGEHWGKKVEVEFTLPVNFKL